MVLVGIVLIGLGLLNLAAPDFLWSLTKFGNDMEGRQSSRTELWDARRILGGGACIALGVVALILRWAAPFGAVQTTLIVRL